MSSRRHRLAKSHHSQRPASRPSSNSPIQAIDLFAPNRYDYTIPLDAYYAIQHHFRSWLVRPEGYVPWREDLNYLIHSRGDVVQIQTRAGYQLREWLDEAGFSAHLRLLPPAPHLTTIDAERLASLIDPMWQLSELLAVCFSGQFEVSTPRDVPQLVRGLTLAFPEAPCVMPFASFDDAAVFRDDLQRIVDEPVTLIRGLGKRFGSRLAVCTYQALLNGDHRTIPLVIVPRWPGSFHQRLKLVARQPAYHRLYLIRTEQDSICPSDNEELRHRIGPILRAFGKHRPRAQHILHTVPFGGRHRAESIQPRSKGENRKMYWRHKRRNQLLASLAHRLSSDEESLRTLPTDQQHVAVLVEVTEHADKLTGLLRGWPIVTNADKSSSLPRCCIITLSAAAACQNLAPYYLINACGGPASPWLESWLNERALSNTAVRIVDLSDGFSGEAATLSKSRQAGYKRAGAVWRPLARHILKPALDALRNSGR